MLGMCVLISFWWLGTVVVQFLGWPIPGSVVGLLGLFLMLAAIGRVPEWLKQPSSLLIRYLTLLFVPAGVGLIEHWARLQSSAIPMLVAISVSTLAAGIIMLAIFRFTKGAR